MLDLNTFDHARYMREALAAADEALARGDGPIGCVIVHGDVIVARGGNRVNTGRNRIDHAEIVAMDACPEYLYDNGRDCVIYTTFEPCAMCIGAIAIAHIRNVVFGCPDPGRGGTAIYDQIGYIRGRIDRYVGGVLEKECAARIAEGVRRGVMREAPP